MGSPGTRDRQQRDILTGSRPLDSEDIENGDKMIRGRGV